MIRQVMYIPRPRTPGTGTGACPFSRGRYECWVGCLCAKLHNAMASIPRDASMFKLDRGEQLQMKNKEF